jgi:hypothetical protein
MYLGEKFIAIVNEIVDELASTRACHCRLAAEAGF